MLFRIVFPFLSKFVGSLSYESKYWAFMNGFRRDKHINTSVTSLDHIILWCQIVNVWHYGHSANWRRTATGIDVVFFWFDTSGTWGELIDYFGTSDITGNNLETVNLGY